ncbi:hypothetical protein EI77_01737 [Prosthecobacter fusiformis]|uniref:Uncharacterized protein n=1 Tax=Prosthecobacter fusiformis TaxID=48464 RepID=A0A4R7S6S3_9BACT|nr:hypothetical protein [Prosthecobacter fusiformis]TDU73268.1 hypothetical protein EI77_01737 [Prosthecobacter fusiformis]
MKNFIHFLSLVILTTASLQAEELPPLTDPDLPQPLDLGYAEDLVTHSPFTRSVNLEESLQLTSISYVNGRPVATVLNKATNERILVFEEPNALGWRLTGAVAGTDLTNTQVEMMVGPELLVMHYHQSSPGTEMAGSPKARLAGKSSGKKEGGKLSVSSLLGDDGRELYGSLSSDARSKFKKIIHEQMTKKPDMTKEQSSAYAQKIYAKIKENDRPSGTPSPKSPKSAKPSKKKQGA